MTPRFNTEADVVEYLARLEHEQWTEWSKSVSSEVSEERLNRWRTLWVPYEDLPEFMKDKDREWARKVMTILNIVRTDDQFMKDSNGKE